MGKKLPKDFFWGGSVSSFQTEGAWDEGGKGLSIYDVRPTPEGHADGSLTVVSNFSLTKSLKTLIISMLLSFFIVKFAKINVLIWANVCYNRHRR